MDKHVCHIACAAVYLWALVLRLYVKEAGSGKLPVEITNTIVIHWARLAGCRCYSMISSECIHNE